MLPLRRQGAARRRYDLLADLDLAGRGLDEAGNQPQGRGLATAGRAKQTHQPAMLDGERYIIDHRQRAVALDQPSKFHRSHAISSPPRPDCTEAPDY